MVFLSALIKKILGREGEDRELLQTVTRSILLTTGGIYLVWHFLATLGWPKTFSPSLWACTLSMAVVFALSLKLLPYHFYVSQGIWFSGLSFVILLAYSLYQAPVVVLLFSLLPMMALVTLGLTGTLLVEGCVALLALLWPRLPWLPPLPETYALGMVFASLATTALSWSFSGNLLSAIDSANYHYKVALERLEEAREHRARISTLLNEISKSNYQLDRLNKMLTYARSKAEEAREERDRFAMSVSHELRSPLNFIIGFSDLMVNSPETYAPVEDWPPGLYDDIQEIYRSSTHLHSLINDILDMGKVDARQMVLFREKVNLGEIVAEVHQMIDLTVQQKGLWLREEIQPNLPEMYVDRTRVRQVLINLVSNALHFTDRGGVTIRVFLLTEGQVQVEVEDTGTGISEEDLPKIFTEFRQAGNQNWRRQEGSGLGLSIGRRFIELHNGKMGVRSHLGHGSTFYFSLPVQDLTVDDFGMSEMEYNQALANVQTRRLVEEKTPLLLFLSTDPFWARIFGESLGAYKVSLLQDPAQLMLAVRRYFPRAIVIDQNLAEDPAVLDFCQKPPYDLPVISFAIPVNLNRVTHLPQGVVRYMVKPVSRQDLAQAVQDLGAQTRRLLVVDDDPTMVRFVRQALRSHEGEEATQTHYRVLTAATGQDALDLLHREPVDAVLLDLDLPDMDGLKVLERIHEGIPLAQGEQNAPPVVHRPPVVIVSANDLPQALAGQQGIFKILVNRPFERRELADVLEAALKNLSTVYPAETED